MKNNCIASDDDTEVNKAKEINISILKNINM